MYANSIQACMQSSDHEAPSCAQPQQQQPGASEGDGTDMTSLPQADDSMLAEEVSCPAACAALPAFAAAQGINCCHALLQLMAVAGGGDKQLSCRRCLSAKSPWCGLAGKLAGKTVCTTPNVVPLCTGGACSAGRHGSGVAGRAHDARV